MNEPHVRAIRALRPGSKFGFTKNSQGNQVIHVDYLLWLDSATPAPSREEVLTEIEKQESEKYKELRAPEYPPLSELADAVYWQAQGDDTKMTTYLAAVDAVKTKYPKVT